MAVRVIFCTRRLSVRELQPQDLELYHDMQGDAEVMRYTTGRPFTLEENRADLHRVIGLYRQPDNAFWVWAVTLEEDEELLGTCALIVNDDGEFEIGYRFRRSHWGKGYGAEVLEGLIEYAVEGQNIKSLVAYVNRENRASVRILEKSVFTFVREFFNADEDCWDREYRFS